VIPRSFKTFLKRVRLKRSAKRIEAGTHSDADLRAIAEAFQSEAFSLASGDRTVSITGNASNAVLIAGDGNTVFVLSGGAADTVRQAFLSSPVQIQKGCRRVSNRLASEIVNGSIVIRRLESDTELDKFLISDNKIAFITGDSGVGKSVFAASQIQRLSNNGWAVLLVRGATFSLEYMAKLIAEDGLDQPLAPGSTYLLRHPWLGELPNGVRGFLVLIDDIVPEVATTELIKFVDMIFDVPPERVKIIASCNSLAWERLNQDYRLPFHKDTATLGATSTLDPTLIRLGTFSDGELSEALRTIGATELIPSRQGDWPDSHIESVRELLSHPATFGHYSHLRRSGGPSEFGELTWSTLIERRLEKALARAANLSSVHPDSLRDYLAQFARMALDEKSHDFRIPFDLIRQRIPQLEVDLQLPSASPSVALQEAGVLLTTSGAGGERLLGFSVSDMGGYVLSFVLEKEAVGKTNEELREVVNVWVQEAWSYHSLIDGLLAWLDRLSENARDTRLLIVLEALVETHLFRTESLFRLVKPSLISAIFDFIREKDSGPVFKYRDAAYAIRPSLEAMREIREHLRDTNSQSQRVAVKLVGQHKDVQSISALVSLLEEPDRDRDLHAAIYSAFAGIGEPAINHLINVVTDLMSSALLRGRCLIALRNIGTLNDQVSAALTFCFEHIAGGEGELLRSALFTASHLRDCNQHSAAMSALTSKDWQSVIAATKVVMECRDRADIPHLYAALHSWTRSESDSIDRTWVVRQLLAALIKIEGSESQNTVLGLLRNGLAGTGIFSPVESVWAADEIDCPGTKALMFEDVIERISTTPPDGLAWQSFNRLGNLWKPDHLSEIVSAAHDLSNAGTPVAERIAGTILDGMHAEGNHPLSDHHAQVAAFKALAKSRPRDFAAEASRLLADAEWTFDLTICDALWVVGDNRAAESLLDKAEQHTSGGQGAWLQRSHAMRALGTCATDEFVAPLISYITSESDKSIYLPSDTIFPLVLRGIISVAKLLEIVRDPQASTYGRVACLQALSILDQREHTDIFSEIAFRQDNEILQDYAIQALGDVKHTAAASDLQQLLINTQSGSLASTIAETLAEIKATQSVKDIIKARSRFGDNSTAFSIALARLGERSALEPLLERLSGDGLLGRGVISAVGLFLPDAQAQRAILEKLETFRGPQLDTGEQRSAIRVLARQDPRLLVERVSRLYRSGRLHKTAREGLAALMPELINAEAVDQTAVVELLKLLLCDPHVQIRRRALEVMFRIDSRICRQVYEELKNGDEWTRACGVLSLGFWASPDHLIRGARRDSQLLIRRAADQALETKSRSADLMNLVKTYQSGGDGLERLSAYLCLEENGDYATMRNLYTTTDKSSLAYVFLRELGEGMKKNSQSRQQREEKEEKDFLSSRGTIKFA